MLHLIAFAPDNKTLLTQSGLAISPGDAVVLLDAGIAFAHSIEAFHTLQHHAGEAVTFYLLGEGTLPDLPVNCIDSAALVTLTEDHAASLSWYP